MRHIRRRFRDFLSQLAGVQGDLQIWWTPGFPIVYVSNPKSGCSTIKHSLKAAQADAYMRSGNDFESLDDPHLGDDCLRKDWLSPRACRQRYVISSVRNPFTRALSGFLDKVNPPDAAPLPEFGYRPVRNFEEYLLALANADQRYVNPHFRAQHFNLDYPRVTYDAIFYLENIAALPRYLSAICPEFELETFAPHSRGASSKVRERYTNRAIELVQEIYARDFELFGYSRCLEDVGLVPGERIAAEGIVPIDAGMHGVPERPRHAMSGTVFESTLRYRRLIDMRLI